MPHIGIAIFSFFLILIGFAGVLVPFLPGVPLAWAGLLVYGYATGFQAISATAIVVFLVLTIVSVVLEFILPLLGAKAYRASKHGIMGAAIGLVIGPLIFHVFGFIIGPLVGAVLGEYFSGAHRRHAVRSGIGVFVGFMLSVALKLGIVLAMLAYFLVALVRAY